MVHVGPPRGATGKLDYTAARFVSLRPGPGGEAEEFREALYEGCGEHHPAGAAPSGDRPFGFEGVQSLANSAARGGVSPCELMFRGELIARNEVLVQDLAAKLVGDVAMQR